MQNRVLLETLMTFPLDTGRGRPSIVDKLCLANGWTRSHALRVVHEYRRFLYLCATFPDRLLPPGDVDQVWQLHLCYTQSYWEELCMKILKRPLHHQPVLHGREERARAYVWYQRARRRYQQEFGEPPPADIWAEPEALFGAGRERCERVNLRRYWIIPKPRLRITLLMLVPAIALPFAFSSFDRATAFVALALALVGLFAGSLWTDQSQRRGMAR
jgi:hypothetical protein